MFLGLLTLITALTISAVAIYYSVAGLVAIFAAAAVPIVIMGGALEIGKLVTAVWLHKHWERATWWLKTYLSVSVAVLMFITSMGIFGFLSKAHIEQTSAAGEGVAQIEQVEKEIARQEAIVLRAEQTIEKTQTSGTGADQNIQAQIDREQARIDTAYDRVQPAIDATNEKLESDKQFYLDQLPAVDEKLARFNELANIDTTDEEAVKRLQSLVGTRPDGAYGGGTARAVTAYKEALEQERTDILAKIEELKGAAQEEIARLRSRAESEIDDSNELIGRLRSQLGQTTGEDIDTIIDEQTQRISRANTELDKLTEEKFTLEAEYRKLEAEVGPIKYIAEFVYGDQANKDLLEEAVRWVIIVIIFVFDPLAVLLLIASQYTFNWYREERDNEDAKKTESTPDRSKSDNDSGTDTARGDSTDSQELDVEQAENTSATFIEESPDTNKIIFPTPEPLDPEEFKEIEVNVQKNDHEYAEDPKAKDSLPEKETKETDDDFDEEFHNAEPRLKDAMKSWKADNPTGSLKLQRRLFQHGKINELPWMEYLEPESDFENADPDAAEAARWAQEQIEASKKKDSVLDGKEQHTTNQEKQNLIKGYVQNAEQGEKTIWSKVRNNE